MPKTTKCPLCGAVMEKKCYVSTQTGEVVQTFLECAKCGVKL